MQEPSSNLFPGRRSGERGAALLLFTLMLALVVLPLVGLAIDGGMVYFAHARLVAAVDAAALAGQFGFDIRARDFWAQSLAVLEGHIDDYERLAAVARAG